MIIIITTLFIILYFIIKPFFRKWQIMSYYCKDKNKIIMPFYKFYHFRHCDGNEENNGLFFPRGYQNNPFYTRCGYPYIEIEFSDE